jgi:hypothetical protein
MIWREIKEIEEVVNFNLECWAHGIRLGYLVYYTEPNNLRIISTSNFDVLEKRKSKANNSFYYIVDDELYVNIDNKLFRQDFGSVKAELICTTEEERIRILNKEFSVCSTYTRRPRVTREVIIRNIDCSQVYGWEDRRYLVGVIDKYKFLFQSFEDDRLRCIDIRNDVEIWTIGFERRIGASRFYKITDSWLVIQDITKDGTNNLRCLDSKSGSIIWRLGQAFPSYNYDYSLGKLYGLGARKFEVIDTETGEREMESELKENLHVASHLTFYAEGYLYFSGYLDQNIPVFGAVNVETGELDFIQEVEMPGERSFRKGLDRPVVVGNRLYVRDAMKVLHVFERQHPLL